MAFIFPDLGSCGTPKTTLVRVQSFFYKIIFTSVKVPSIESNELSSAKLQVAFGIK